MDESEESNESDSFRDSDDSFEFQASDEESDQESEDEPVPVDGRLHAEEPNEEQSSREESVKCESMLLCSGDLENNDQDFDEFDDNEGGSFRESDGSTDTSDEELELGQEREEEGDEGLGKEREEEVDEAIQADHSIHADPVEFGKAGIYEVITLSSDESDWGDE